MKKAELAKIYGTLSDDLLSAAYHLLGDVSAAEDVLQDVFVKLARDVLRRRKRERGSAETLDHLRSREAGPAEAAAVGDEAASVAATLAGSLVHGALGEDAHGHRRGLLDVIDAAEAIEEE